VNKECDEKGVKSLERKEHPLMVYPCKANLQINQRKQKNTLTHSREARDQYWSADAQDGSESSGTMSLEISDML
jgi:hypothetical protein